VSVEQRADILELIRDYAIGGTLSRRKICKLLEQEHGIKMSSATVRNYLLAATQGSLERIDTLSEDIARIVVGDLVDNWHDLQAQAAGLDILAAIEVLNDSMSLAEADRPTIEQVSAAQRVIKAYHMAMDKIDRHAHRINALTGIGERTREATGDEIIVMHPGKRLNVPQVSDTED